MIQFCLSVLCVTSSQSSKKAKFSSDSLMPRDPRLRAKSSGILSTSPQLPHKVPAGVKLRHGPLGGDLYIGLAGEELRHGPAVEGDVQHGLVVEDLRHGTLGGELRDKDIEDYFQLFKDECSLQSHTCTGRVARVLNHVGDKVIEPPYYDLRNIVDLLDKYGDAHISDSGWREVDEEEWFE